MRLLQLLTGEAHLLDLHPQVSVVRSLDAEARHQLAAAVTGLARHEATGQGLLEAHGILFDLDPDLLSLLDRRADVDPVVRPTDLPGGARVDEVALRAQEQRFEELLARMAAAVEVQQAATAEVDASTTALREAQQLLDSAVEERVRSEAEAESRRAAAEATAAAERVERAAAEEAARWAAVEREEVAQRARAEALARLEVAEADLAALEAERSELLRQREDLQDRLDPAAAEDLAAARGALSSLSPPSAPRDAAERPEPTSDGAPPEGTRSPAEGAAPEGMALPSEGASPEGTQTPAGGDAPAVSASSAEAVDPGADAVLIDDHAGPGPEALAAWLAVIEEVLDELDRIDPAGVEAALAEARSPAVLVPSVEAQELAEELAAVEEEIRAAESAGVPDLSAEEASEAAERLAEARDALAHAEDAARSHHLTPEDAAALEAAHAALHDALERADSRVGGIRARGQVERLRAEEQALLDRLGFVTYAEYLMGTAAAHRDPKAEADLEEARLRLAEAEGAWSAVEERRAAVLSHAQLLDRRRQLVAAAASLLGRPVGIDDDLTVELRGHQEPAPGADEPVRALGRALAGVGVELEVDDFELDDLVAIADSWLEEAAGLEERRASLAAAREETRAALDAVLADASTGAPAPAHTPVETVAMAAPAVEAVEALAPPAEELEPVDPLEEEVAPVDPPVRDVAPAGVPGDDQPPLGAVDASEPADLEVDPDAERDSAWDALEAAQDRWERHETARAALEHCAAALNQLAARVAVAEQALAEAQAAVDDVAVTAALEDPAGAGPQPASVERSDEDRTGPPTSSTAGEAEELDEDPACVAARGAEAAAQVALEEAEASHRAALERLEAAEEEVAELTGIGEVVAAELEELQELHRAAADAPPPDPAELEWYLVARVAAQRAVSVAGSAPLLLEEPFGGLSDSEVHHLLGRLERVAETVQVIVLSDHPAVASWVEAAGEARAAVVEPTSA